MFSAVGISGRYGKAVRIERNQHETTRQIVHYRPVAHPDRLLLIQEPQLTEQQMRDFLLNAKVLKSRETSKGLTGALRLTLSDGTITHDASFQPIDQTKTVMEYSDGRREFNFRDSYKYNVAAYELALLLGLGDMMPVTVVRKWEGKTGSLDWWLPVKMDEAQRLEKKIEPPVPEAWNRQMYKIYPACL
jgi:hypothetical protein